MVPVKGKARKGQFFIITAVLLAGALMAIMTVLTSASTVDYSTVLERHSFDVVSNVGQEINDSWWDTSWDYRKMFEIRERTGSFLVNESVNVVLDARRSRVSDDCSDVRVLQGGRRVAWDNTTACNVDTYRSDTSALVRYIFDSRSSPVRDVTGNGRDAVINGNPSFISGRYGYGMRFDGSDDYLSASGAPDLDGNITVMAWIRTTDTGTVVADDNNDNGWNLSVTNGVVSFGVRGVSTVTGTTTVDDGGWHHVTGSLNVRRGVQRVYVDGELDASRSVSGTPSTDAGGLTVAGQSTGSFLDATVDDVRVYNRTFSPATVEGVAENGIGLNVSTDLKPLETRRVFVYYGNRDSPSPALKGAAMNHTALAERPEVVDRGRTRKVKEVLRRMQVQVKQIDRGLGASLDFFIRTGCDVLTLQSPQTTLEMNIC
ncbi:MAG: LamG domain-containing protein [Candidatus Nanohaloarchaea archaeon]